MSAASMKACCPATHIHTLNNSKHFGGKVVPGIGDFDGCVGKPDENYFCFALKKYQNIYDPS